MQPQPIAQTTAQASIMGRRLGNYQVRALIGCGAMGAVYLAQDEVLDRPVALKVLLGSLARNPEHVRRFQREARAAARMNHPNIVRIYEAGVREGIPFMAMEYVDGESFDRFLARAGSMPWRRALEVALQMAQALACAHEQGVVHRDVKPANMLIDKTGRLRLADFGIARVRDQGSGLTDHDAFIGTPEFMSPEQCLGEREIGPQADLFSLGVTLYRMISGRLPFIGSSTASLIAYICHDTPPRLNRLIADVPDDVARLVARLMDKHPANRPESAVLVAATISELLESDGGTSVISAALDAFMRDQAQPREVELWTTPTPSERKTEQKKRGPVVRKKTRRVHYAPVSPMARWSAAALLAVALAGAGLWYASGLRPVEAAPSLGKAAFTMAAPGVYRLPLPDGPWQVADLQWTPDGQRIVALLEGNPTSPMAGARGVITVSAQDGGITSVVAPGAPWRGEPQAAMPSLALAGEALLRAAPMQGSSEWALLEHKLNLVQPERTPLGTLPARPAAIAAAQGVVAVAVSAGNGEMIYAHAGQQWTPWTLEPVSLLDDSMHFTPSGEHLMVQLRASGEEGLWRISAREGRMERVARGAWRGVAMHESGEWAIAQDVAGMLHRLPLNGKGDITPIGQGTVSTHAFAPSGDFALACMSDAAGSQLVALPASESQPIVLARMEDTQLRGARVSPDGTRAAAVIATAGGEDLAIASLSEWGLAPRPEAAI